MLGLLSHFLSALCGQNPDHTWAPGGDLLPCCQRCTGLYVGAAVATVLHMWVKPRLTAWFLGVHGMFLLLMVPCGLYWVPQGPVFRNLSGVLFGFAVSTFLRAPLGRTGEPSGATPNQRRLTPSRAGWLYGASLAVTLCVLPLVAARGGRSVGVCLSGTAFFGALALGALALASIGRTLLTGLEHLTKAP